MPRRRTYDDGREPRLYLLDMGSEKYGDCVLCQVGDRTILIDGGHPGDWRGRGGYESIPQQLEEVLGHGPPFRVALLVVTHCHSDHIGCLPALVEKGILESEWALVADEKMGFGRAADYVPPDAPSPADRLAAILREEDYTRSTDDELIAFLSDAATLENRYQSMLNKLEQGGARVVRYGRNNHDDLQAAFSDFGLELLGPSQDQSVAEVRGCDSANQ